MARKKSTPRKNFTRVKKSRKPRRVGKKAVAKIAKRVVNSMTETKFMRTAVFNGSLYGDPAALNYQNNFFSVAPTIGSITQGTGQGNRIGNKIRLTRVVMNVILNATDSSWPRYIMMYIISDKRYPTDVTEAQLQDACNGAAGSGNNILQDGNQSIGFQKRLTDVMQRINDDRFTVYKKRCFRLGYANQPVGTAQGNNDFPFMRRIKINLLKYMPKLFRYADASTVPALQRRVYVCFHVVSAQGGQLAATDVGCNINYAYDIKFKDL